MLVTLVIFTGCNRVEDLLDFSEPLTPYNAYADGLRQAGLAQTALGRDWLAAGSSALQAPSEVRLPVDESGVITAEAPRAIAFRVKLERGRRVVLSTTLSPARAVLIFVDVFRVPEEPGDSLRHVTSADSAAASLVFEPRRSAEYIIRMQPELLRGGRYRVILREEPALAFPVQGRGNAAIQSGFGAPRDGGARDHHGVDIFAPRGTPALAVTEAYVTRVRETARGGRVVWLRDERRGLSLYYAHLDQQLVQAGDRVSIGDTIGLIGNTGNARTTPPHLHFGVYQQGPLDPWPWVGRIATRPLPPAGDTTLIARWVRTTKPTVLKAGSTEVALATHTPLQILGARERVFRVTLADGQVGEVLHTVVTPVTGKLSAELLPSQPTTEEPMAGREEQRRQQKAADRQQENEQKSPEQDRANQPNRENEQDTTRRTQQTQPKRGISPDEPAEGRTDVSEENEDASQENVRSDRNTNSQPDRNNR